MSDSTISESREEYSERFLEYIQAFAEIGKDSGIFPKTCHTCGVTYESFPDYIHRTSPLGHGLEPYTNSLDVLSTMQYRNCLCGSTLAITFTKKNYPMLERFWEMLGKESKATGKPLWDVVGEFREQCNRYIISRRAEKDG